MAAHRQGWLVISESGSTGLLDRIATDHLPRLLAQVDPRTTRLTGVSAGVGTLGSVGASWVERHPAESTIRSQLDHLTDLLRPHGTGVAITLDEAHGAQVEDLRKLGEVVQFARREDRLVGFAAAGLSAYLARLLDHPGTTFLRRAERHTITDVTLARQIYEPALRPLSKVARAYLAAMAADPEGPSRTAAVAQRMGVTVSYAQQYRARLLDAGIIEAPARGLVRFTIPGLGAYLDQKAHDTLEEDRLRHLPRNP